MLNNAKIMKERIRRVQILFKELGFSLSGGLEEDGIFAGGFESPDSFEGNYAIDNESKFLELSFSFVFSHDLGAFVKGRLEEMLALCYDYGCYVSFDSEEEEIGFSVFSKLYYAGLNYYALRETLYDFMDCVDDLKELLSFETAQSNGFSGETL